MLFQFLLFISSLLSLAFSAAIGPWHHEPWGQSYRDYVTGIRQALAATSTFTCVTPANSDMPSSTLPPPSQGLTVYHVALGRGLQVSLVKAGLSPVVHFTNAPRTTLALLMGALRLFPFLSAPSPIFITLLAWLVYPYLAGISATSSTKPLLSPWGTRIPMHPTASPYTLSGPVRYFLATITSPTAQRRPLTSSGILQITASFSRRRSLTLQRRLLPLMDQMEAKPFPG